MRLLTVLFLCGFFVPLSGGVFPSSHSMAMQGSPTPATTATSAFCSDEQIWRGYTVEEQQTFSNFEERQVQSGSTAAVLYPESETVGVVSSIDVEHSDEATRFAGDLGLTYLTLPSNACRSGSLFYPSAVITVTAGTIEIFVEPGSGGPSDAPAPVGTIQESDGSSYTELTLPGPVTITEGQWVTLQNRSRVDFRNSSSSDATVLVAANHPPTTVLFRGCASGCSSRRP